MALLAHLETRESATEARTGAGAHLRLDTPASDGLGRGCEVLVYALTRAGFMIETPVALVAGESVQVRLADGDHFPADVVWAGGNFARCKFRERLPGGIVEKAALLGVVRTLTDAGRGEPLATGPAAKRWPPAKRTAIKVGLSLPLWGLIGLAIWGWL